MRGKKRVVFVFWGKGRAPKVGKAWIPLSRDRAAQSRPALQKREKGADAGARAVFDAEVLHAGEVTHVPDFDPAVHVGRDLPPKSGAIRVSFSVIYGTFPDRFGRSMVPTTRAVRVSIEHSPSSLDSTPVSTNLKRQRNSKSTSAATSCGVSFTSSTPQIVFA